MVVSAFQETCRKSKWVIEKTALRKWYLAWVSKDELEIAWPILGRRCLGRGPEQRKMWRVWETERWVWLELRLGGEWKGSRSCKTLWDVGISGFYPKCKETFIIIIIIIIIININLFIFSRGVKNASTIWYICRWKKWYLAGNEKGLLFCFNYCDQTS